MAGARGDRLSHRSRLVAVTAAVLVLLGTGCSTGETGRDARAASPSASDDPDLALCLARQKGGFAGVHAAVQRLTQAALLHQEIPTPVVRRAQDRVTGLPDERDPPCDEPLASLRDALEALEPGPLDEAALRRVITEVDRWRAALRRDFPGPIVYQAAPRDRDLQHEAWCTTLRKHARMTHQVRYRDRAGDRQGWVVVTLTNDWDRWLGIGHGGWLHVRRDRDGPVVRRVQWGASSNDYFWVAAGRTGRSQHETRVTLGPRGTITPARVTGGVYTEDVPGYCDVPSRPARPPEVHVGNG